MTEHNTKLVKLVIQGVLVLVLIIAMTWIVLSPQSDEISKVALMIVSSAVGFFAGKSTNS